MLLPTLAANLWDQLSEAEPALCEAGQWDEWGQVEVQ